jgi:uncharacterized protein YaaN involved in tellurite resistance
MPPQDAGADPRHLRRETESLETEIQRLRERIEELEKQG